VNVIIIAATVWLVLGWIGLVLLVVNARRNRRATPSASPVASPPSAPPVSVGGEAVTTRAAG
jgi:hypothetical protein